LERATIKAEPSCRDLVAFLADYLCGELSREETAACDAHVAQCIACASYAATYRAAVAASKAAFDGPEAFAVVSEKLVQAILARRRKEP
jgi:anti-sigma factor RsiW